MLGGKGLDGILSARAHAAMSWSILNGSLKIGFEVTLFEEPEDVAAASAGSDLGRG